MVRSVAFFHLAAVTPPLRKLARIALVILHDSLWSCLSVPAKPVNSSSQSCRIQRSLRAHAASTCANLSLGFAEALHRIAEDVDAQYRTRAVINTLSAVQSKAYLALQPDCMGGVSSKSGDDDTPPVSGVQVCQHTNSMAMSAILCPLMAYSINTARR